MHEAVFDGWGGGPEDAVGVLLVEHAAVEAAVDETLLVLAQVVEVAQDVLAGLHAELREVLVLDAHLVLLALLVLQELLHVLVVHVRLRLLFLRLQQLRFDLGVLPLESLLRVFDQFIEYPVQVHFDGVFFYLFAGQD